ncbi:MAG: heme-binding protein [Sporolactobacillus sp.]
MIKPKILEQQEDNLRFTTFDHTLALRFAECVDAIITREHEKPVAVCVTLDGQTILDYRTTGRQGSGWLARKVRTVLAAKHSSMYTYLHRLEKPYQEWVQDPQYAVCGGGFPLHVANVLRGVLAVSGLNHEDDHRVLVEALETVLIQQRNERKKE